MDNILLDVIQFIGGMLIVALAIEAIAEFIVSAEVLDYTGIRPWVNTKCWSWIVEASKCHYCTSAWISIIMVWFIPGDYFSLYPWNNVFIKLAVVHRIATIQNMLIRGRVKVYDLEIKLTTVNSQPQDASDE